jgi:hypothetical protein
MANNRLDVTTLENWLWEVACKIRGDTRQEVQYGCKELQKTI